MPRASMRLTGTAAGDLRRSWRASSAVSCESRGGFVVLTRRSTAEGASQSGGLVSLLFVFFSGVGNMSEEWDEVVHEVELVVGRLSSFRDDLLAAYGSGALTETQMDVVDLMMGQALGTGMLLDAYVQAPGKLEAAEKVGE